MTTMRAHGIIRRAAGRWLARGRARHHVVPVRSDGAVLDGAVARRLPAPGLARGPDRWFDAGDLKVDWTIRVDTLTAVMLVVLNPIGPSCIFIRSATWRRTRTGRASSAYLSLFTFAMLVLVTADNLVQLFFGWEGVGLVSYLLIGFWYSKPEANAAAIKAFVVNRVGDFGFALGIFALFMMTGAIDFDTVFAQAPSLTARPSIFGWDGRRADLDLPACCSWARWASRRSSCCTSGCRTPWKARRRSPR